MNLKKSLAAGAVTIAATAGVAVLTTGTAFADWDGCPNGAVCGWEHSNGKGAVFAGVPNTTNLGSMNDKISSVWNRTNFTICFHHDSNFNGPYMLLGPGSWMDQVAKSLRGHREDGFTSPCPRHFRRMRTTF